MRIIKILYIHFPNTALSQTLVTSLRVQAPTTSSLLPEGAHNDKSTGPLLTSTPVAAHKTLCPQFHTLSLVLRLSERAKSVKPFALSNLGPILVTVLKKL